MTRIICGFRFFTFETFFEAQPKHRGIGESRALRIIGKWHESGKRVLNQRANPQRAPLAPGSAGCVAGRNRLLISNAQLRFSSDLVLSIILLFKFTNAGASANITLNPLSGVRRGFCRN
ncbi:hypothetical protein [Burkholderia sp. SRS-W-2-2016]|uniref:hypothetical protein n=1 Tax=Burkholderia sp. SRS-W-2-2016 TaxID=1926878 RepID=UPI00117D72FE|nr:hypothetical protein [Burkholderia sp. SRS-W-2-2016]